MMLFIRVKWIKFSPLQNTLLSSQVTGGDVVWTAVVVVGMGGDVGQV